MLSKYHVPTACKEQESGGGGGGGGVLRVRLVPRRDGEGAASFRAAVRHHYLGGNKFNHLCDAYLFFVSGQPVAFVATLPMPGKVRASRRGHRLVVKPDFQGVGLGGAVSRYAAKREICDKRRNADAPEVGLYKLNTFYP
jgi:GNAT superfamily N-acetyltransferase